MSQLTLADSGVGSEQEVSTPRPVSEKLTIKQHLDHAKAKGIKYPSIKLGDYRFKLAGETSKNPGAVYVITWKNGEYLGKVIASVFYPVHSMVGIKHQEIQTILEDLHEAIKIHGQRTGTCCFCGRLLIKGISIEAMMGPICAGNYGFFTY